MIRPLRIHSVIERLSCALSEGFGFKNDAQDRHMSPTEREIFHTIL